MIINPYSAYSCSKSAANPASAFRQQPGSVDESTSVLLAQAAFELTE